MLSVVARVALIVASTARTGAPPAVPVATTCSNDALSFEGTTLGIEVCAPSRRAAGKAPLELTETFSVKGQPPYVRTLPVDLAESAESARTIDDVALARLGIAKTIHLTIEWKPGNVRLEHALLVPGAVVLK